MGNPEDRFSRDEAHIIQQMFCGTAQSVVSSVVMNSKL